MASMNTKVDALVIGGGIAGMQTALDIADQGYQVALVERKESIGGKMIQLSKVFPTLDCCSCITTPKMSAVAHHENIQLFTYADVQKVERDDAGAFAVEVLQKPRYVDIDVCTGCRECEYACPVDITSDFDLEYGVTRAIRVPFSTAVPQKAMIGLDDCILCGKCVRTCPHDAIDFGQQPELFTIETDTVILATGFEVTPRDMKAEYNAAENPNVISGMFMERLLAPTGPYGHVIRPGDGMEPDSIAYVQCAGSRDASLGIEYCSRVCCMYAIKQAMLLSGALPLADITIYYMDIRTFGKGYEQFYQNAKAMGIEFVKAKVAKITHDDDMNPILRVEMIEEGGGVEERQHDLVVLSVGLQAGYNHSAIYNVDPDNDGFVTIPSPNLEPTQTTEPGIFVTGCAGGPMDIVDSIVMAGAAAADAAGYLESRNGAKAPAEASEVVHA